MTPRESLWFHERCKVVEYFALLGQFSPVSQVDAELPSVLDPMRWFAELGVREGRWLREKAQGAAA